MGCKFRKPSSETSQLKSPSPESRSVGVEPSSAVPSGVDYLALTQRPETQAETDFRFLALEMGIFI